MSSSKPLFVREPTQHGTITFKQIKKIWDSITSEAKKLKPYSAEGKAAHAELITMIQAIDDEYFLMNSCWHIRPNPNNNKDKEFKLVQILEKGMSPGVALLDKITKAEIDWSTKNIDYLMGKKAVKAAIDEILEEDKNKK